MEGRSGTPCRTRPIAHDPRIFDALRPLRPHVPAPDDELIHVQQD
jgi:hypothetical protein